MSKSVDRLLSVLKTEHELYQAILELSKTKKQIIIDGKTNELNEMTKQEQKMIKAMLDLEKNRSSVVEAIEKELGIGPVQNITELLGYLDGEHQASLLTMKEELTSVVKELDHQNEINGRLIGQSLEIIDFNLNLLSTSQEQHAGYGSDADEKDVKRKSNLFDVRV